MRNKKNKNKKNIFILIIVIIILLFSLVIIIDDNRKLTNLEKIFKDSFFTISNILSIPFQKIKENISDINNYEKEKNAIESLTINQELLEENNELKQLLELNHTLNEREYINASVINRNIDYWFNELTINKGTKDGISENMAVITSKGLIGQTIKVTKNTAIVKLLTNNKFENKISVKISYEDKFVYGLLSSYKDGYFIVDGISNNIDIIKGATVTTSGLSQLFPSGILIGYVEDISTDNFDLAKTLKIKSDVDFNDIYYVTILKRNVDEEND